jgi:hypothetical protein
MSYLILTDYQKQIQTDNLNQVTTSLASVRTAAELAAQAECTSYIVQRYDTEQEFTDTCPYNPGLTYRAANRVYLDAAAYNPAATYSVGTLVLQTGTIYSCTTDIEVPEAFNPLHWALVGNQYDLYYAVYPWPVFNIYGLYKVGDKVWWKDHIYTALIHTIPIDHDALIQFGDTNDVPFQNIWPDNRVEGMNYWQDNGLYSVPPGNIANPLCFAQGDNRSQQMVMYMIDITLYHLHSRIAPRNIPQLRIDRYENAVNWLKMVMKGSVSAALPKRQPVRGARIRAGSNIKNINTY